MQMLSPLAITNLKPSKLSLSLVSVYHPKKAPLPEGVDGPSPDITSLISAEPRVQNLTKRMQDMGLKLVGEIWGLKLKVGE